MSGSADRPNYLPALDGLRAVAVLLVIWSHVLPHTPGYPVWLAMARQVIAPGNLGVEIFFVLSGFLITRILVAERARGQPVRWFLLRRMLRIFPIFYLLIAVMAVLAPGPALLWCAGYLSNFYFMANPEGSFMGPTWSLCVEEHFYLLWPMAVAFLPGPWARRLMTWGVIPFAIGLALIVCHEFDVTRTERIVRYGSPFRFLGLGVGCLFAFGEAWLRARPGRSALLGLLLLLLGVASWPVFWVMQAPEVLGVGLPLQDGPALWLPHSALCAGGLVLLVLAGAFAGSCLVRPLVGWLPRSIGRISYGLYLYHLPVFGFVLHPAPSLPRAALAIAATFATATASDRLIERPLLRFGSRFRQR